MYISTSLSSHISSYCKEVVDLENTTVKDNFRLIFVAGVKGLQHQCIYCGYKAAKNAH